MFDPIDAPGNEPEQTERRPFIRGRDVSELISDFTDNVWDIGAITHAKNVYPGNVEFSKIFKPHWIPLAKELGYALLNERISPRARRVKPTALRRILVALAPFLDYVEEAGRDLPSVRQSDLTKFLSGGVMAPLSPSRRQLTVRAIRTLWSHRRFLTETLTFCPWGSRTNNAVAEVASKRGTDNKTPRIPEGIAGPLLSWALFYVEVASADLIAASRHWFELVANAQGSPSRPEERRRVLSWVEDQVTKGLPLPLSFPRPERQLSQKSGLNRRLIFARAGVRPFYLQTQEWTRILKPYEKYGVTGDLGLPLSLDPRTGRPWRTTLDQPELDYERRHLQMACLTVILFLTGMRVMEAATLERGCATTSPAPGNRKRYKVEGATFKNNDRPTGKRAVWVTIEPVHQAIGILEQMNDSRFLFVDEGRGSNEHLSTNAINLRLKDFCLWVNANLSSPERPPIPLELDGDTFQLTSRSFRRTLAWYIAAKPFGIVAGGRQYQHLSKRIFEGYAGTSDSGFRQEVEAELDLRNRRDIVDIYESEVAGEVSTGPASGRINREMARIHDSLTAYPGTVVDERRRDKMLAHMGRTLHRGVLTDCFFDPATALCRSKDSEGSPVFELCQPTKCANSRISIVHEGAWLERGCAARALAANGALSELEIKPVEDYARTADAVVRDLRGEIPK